jgi:hypothetical protein
MLLLKGASTSSAMGATAYICCVEDQNVTCGDMDVAAYP